MVVFIISFLLMIAPVKPRFILRKLKMNPSVNFRNLRILLRTRQVDISMFSEQIMEKNLTLTSMMIFVELLGLRES
jgi:hypothetical protein